MQYSTTEDKRNRQAYRKGESNDRKKNTQERVHVCKNRWGGRQSKDETKRLKERRMKNEK